MSVAIVTGASRGLGLALTRELAGRGWTVVVDARVPAALTAGGRARDRGSAVASSVKAAPGYPRA